MGNGWLAPGETVVYMWPGSTAEPGLLGRLTARSATLEATSRHRLRLSLERDGGGVDHHVFDGPGDIQVRIVGPGARRVAMLPTVLVEFAWPGNRVQLLVNDTVATYLPRWSSAFASLHDPGPASAAAISPPNVDETQLVLPCTTCGSPMGSPDRLAAMTCPNCGAHTVLPVELAARRAFLIAWLTRARQAADLFTDEQAVRISQLERDSYSQATMLAALPTVGILIATVVGPAVVQAFRRPPGPFGREVLEFGQACGWLGAMLGIVAGLVLANRRRRRIYREQLRDLIACLPPEAGVSARCRYCGGPIELTEGFVTCTYCGACNLATANVARHATSAHRRRARVFDVRAAEVCAAERAHVAKLVSEIRFGHALGMIVLGPVFAGVLSLALAAIHLLVG